jgi:hypothetical protein
MRYPGYSAALIALLLIQRWLNAIKKLNPLATGDRESCFEYVERLSPGKDSMGQF